MIQPQGFEVSRLEDLNCLHSNLFLYSSGWHMNYADPNLYFLWNGTSILVSITIILLFVEDLLLTKSDDVAISHVKYDLKHKYEMKDLGPATKYLGLQFDFQLGGSLFINKTTS